MGASPGTRTVTAWLLNHQRRSPVSITHPLHGDTSDNRPQLEQRFCYIVYSVNAAVIARSE
jgi:hypothetical protein